MTFAAPWVALALALVPLIVLAHRRSARRNAAARASLAGKRGDAARVPFRTWLIALGLGALVIAAMRPQWGETETDVSRSGRDIVVLLDVSLSMLASDGDAGAEVTRFERARQGLEGLLEQLERDGGHRIALVTFSGRSTLMSPLSTDYALFRARLALADPRNAPGPGTQVRAALETTLREFVAEAPEYTDVLLLSDGEDFSAAGDYLRPPAARLHAVSIGASETPVLLTVLGNDGRRVTIEYRGQPVRTQAAPDALRALVEDAADPLPAGRFENAGTETVDLLGWYSREIEGAPTRLLEQSAQAQPAERYGWFVALALLALSAHGAMRLLQRRNLTLPSGVTTAVGLAVAFVTLSLTGFSLLEPASRALSDGYGAFTEGRFVAARDAFATAVEHAPDNATAHFNLGAARYRTYDLDGAIAAFEHAATSDHFATRAHYNEGVVHFQRAIANLENEDEAPAMLRAAIDAFRSALARDEDDENARYNLSLALLLLYQLEAHDQSLSNNASGRDPNARPQAGAEPEDGRKGEDRSNAPNESPGAGNIGQDMSGLAGKAASGPGAQNAMSGQGQRGQRAQALSRSDAEDLLARLRLDTRNAIDEANRQRLNRMRAGASGPFW